MTDTDTDPRQVQATNLGGQLGGGQPQQGPPQNPYQIGGRNPWQMAVDLIRPPQGQPGIFSGERQDPTNTTPQNYIPAQRRSDHTMWGKDDAVLEGARRYPGVTPGPFMPYGQAQLAQVFHESAAGLANIGSGAVGPLGMQSAAYQTAFIKARMQKQEWEARMNQYRMRETAQKLEDEQRKESLAYGEIFAEYGDDKDKLKEALRKHAMEKVGGLDQPIITALENGGTDAAKRVLQERDYYYLGLAKTNQQRKDEDEQSRTRRFLDPSQTEPTSAQPTTTTVPSPTSPTTTPPPAPTPTPTLQPPNLPRLPNVSQGVRDAATTLQMGGKPIGVPNTPQAEDAVAQYQNALDHYMRGLTDPRSNVPPDQVMPLIRDKNPKMADLTQGILDGTITPTATESAKEPFATALNLARKINPNLQRDWAQRQERQDAATMIAYRGDFAKQLASLSGMREIVPRNLNDMDRLIALSEKTNTAGVPVLQRWINAGRQNVEGDPDVTRFHTALKEFQRDAGNILTTFGTGNRYTVYAQRMMESFVDEGQTPQQFRAMAEILKRGYGSIILPQLKEVNRLGERVGGRNFKPENADDILQQLGPPQSAIDHLKSNPSLAPMFDQKYGSGWAEYELGR